MDAIDRCEEEVTLLDTLLIGGIAQTVAGGALRNRARIAIMRLSHQPTCPRVALARLGIRQLRTNLDAIIAWA